MVRNSITNNTVRYCAVWHTIPRQTELNQNSFSVNDNRLRSNVFLQNSEISVFSTRGNNSIRYFVLAAWVTVGLNASFLNYLRLTILSLEHHKAREPQYYQILQAQSSNQGEEVVICGLHKLQAQQLDRDGFLPKKLSAFRLAFFALVPIPILADMKLKH